MLLTLTLVAFLVGTIVAAPNSDESECPRIMSEAGLSPAFAQKVAHGAHSLSLEDIRYYFKPDAPLDNGIPTVNLDLKSDERVLPNAPLVGYDDDFTTTGLKTFDLVMRNMNRTAGTWGIAKYNVLETLGHALHMSEAWSNSVQQYQLIAKFVDPDSDVCACVTDIENNGVMNHLQLTAFKIRYPGITTGNDNITQHYLAHSTDSEFQGSDNSHVKVKRDVGRFFDLHAWYYYYARQHRSGDFDGIDFDLSDVELLEDIAEKLADGDMTELQHLDSAEHWTAWKAMLTVAKDESAYFDFAMFMFCMLN